MPPGLAVIFYDKYCLLEEFDEDLCFYLDGGKKGEIPICCFCYEVTAAIGLFKAGEFLSIFILTNSLRDSSSYTSLFRLFSLSLWYSA
ncbi:hypothetical protein FGO68_gene16690 [Halteria grandinella]|uniref:Uncharacterized protein n=1 Tax=Halteria grandinella TaxID=5974 RepID=A0A8J8NLS3_HALGN|nr:hypothetical protein FGO68_gene16690 [Halteria grandinella]